MSQIIWKWNILTINSIKMKWFWFLKSGETAWIFIVKAKCQQPKSSSQLHESLRICNLRSDSTGMYPAHHSLAWSAAAVISTTLKRSTDSIKTWTRKASTILKPNLNQNQIKTYSSFTKHKFPRFYPVSSMTTSLDNSNNINNRKITTVRAYCNEVR